MTAEELMRSRYSAYAVGDLDYVWRTWHPRTRPDALTPSDEVWTGLEILNTAEGREGDQEGVVEFRAHYHSNSGRGVQRERSRFSREAGRWCYVSPAS